MGLFSSKKVISVASSVYNLAGDEKDRPDFLKSLMMRNLLSGTKDSVGDTMRNGYLNGPAIRFRQFYNWAKKPEHYGLVGLPTGNIKQGNDLNASSMEQYVPHTPPDQVWAQHAIVSKADISYWAEDWIMKNRPAELTKAWVTVYDEKTKKITITFVDLSKVSFTPANYDSKATYVYTYYIIIKNSGNNATITYSSDKLFIYKVGSGTPGIDKLVNDRGDYGQFLPYIPVRLFGDFITASKYPKVYKQVKRAYKRATSGKYDELIEKLEDNKDIDDIDHAYIVFGVSLNVVEESCKRYLYNFFEKLQFSQIGGPTAYNAWKNVTAFQGAVYTNWKNWKNALDNVFLGGPDPGPEPPRPHIAELSKNEIRITNPVSVTGSDHGEYDIRLAWSYIANGRGEGLGRPQAKKNECWLKYMGEDTIARNYYSATGDPYAETQDLLIEKIRIYQQHVETVNGKKAYFYTWLDIVGLRHENFIYEGKSVQISAKDALDSDEESGFIVPLHHETWEDTRIMDTSQMGTACVFLVINSYEITKQKWYEKGIFRIIFVIVIAIASVVLTGGAGIGLLGAHLAVGTALGLTGLTAAIVGSVINALAALVLSTLLEKLTVALGIVGPIITAIFGMMIGNLMSGMQGGIGGFNWGSMFRAENLMKLMDAAGGTVQQVMRAEMVDMQAESLKITDDSSEAYKKIKETYIAEYGYGKISIDPLEISENTNANWTETSDTFLARTLLTGSDIVDMSMDVVHQYAEYSLALPKAFT